jgi:hypothetical protein
MRALQMRAPVGLGAFGTGIGVEELDERELVETTAGLILAVALLIVGAAGLGVLIGAAVYVLTH